MSNPLINTDGCSASSEGAPALPVDLLGDIFQNLRSEYSKSDLMSCTLVSRTWRRFALETLFSDLSLKFYNEFVEENPAGDGGRPNYPKLSTFVRFLQSSPHIATCIRHLTLICREYDMDEDSDLDSHHVARPTLISILDELPLLRTVRLCDVLLVEPAFSLSNTIPISGRTPVALDTLHLDYNELSGDSGVPFFLEEILAPLGLLASLETLIIANVTLKATRYPDFFPQLGIRGLRLEEVDSVSCLICDLQPTQILHNLRSLDAGYISEDDLEALQEILDEVHPRLTHFSCAFASERIHMEGKHDISMIVMAFGDNLPSAGEVPPFINPSHPFFDALNLSRCHSLASLEFQLVLFHNVPPNQLSVRNEQQWRCMIYMLSYIGSDPKAPALSITFSIDTSPLEGIIAEHLLTLLSMIGEVENELCRLAEENRVAKVQVVIRRWGVEIHDDYARHLFPKLGRSGHLVAL